MRVLVTGGAGFIGSNIVPELLRQGFEVSVIDNFLTGNKENLAPFLADIKFIEGSILEEEKLSSALEGVSYVLHQAALPSVPRSLEDPLKSLTNNTVITLKLLEACRKIEIKKFVYASSSSVYGDQKQEYKREDLTPQPLSPYAVFKLAGEYLCKNFSQLYHMPTVSLRYFNVFGPNQDPHSSYSAVIPLFIKTMIKGEAPQINGDGTISRDFTYVANNVKANLLAMLSDKVGQGEVINIAMGGSITLNQLVENINGCLNKKIKPVHGQERPGDIKFSKADIGLAKKLLGYVPAVDFEPGLRQTVEFYQKHL